MKSEKALQEILNIAIDALKIEGQPLVIERNCAACNKPVGYGYMVRDDLWLQCAAENEVMHLGCFSEKIGRRLRPDDFTGAPVNDPILHMWKMGFDEGIDMSGGRG